MGWKCDLVVIDDSTRPVRELLAALVGGPLRHVEAISLDEAIACDPPLGGIHLGGRVALFLGSVRPLIQGATPALEGRLLKVAQGRPVLALHLDSVFNAYGWASWAGGTRVRTRLGQHPEVILDSGQPLRTEAEFFASYRQRGNRYLDAAGESWSHDQLGEEVVFALFQAALGWRSDGEELDARVDRFEVEKDAVHHTLDVEGEVSLANPSAEDVANALRSLRAKGPSFAILDAKTGGYVQAGGASKAMVVEARLIDDAQDTFTHHSAGRGGSCRPLRRVPMSGGGVHAPGNEVLDVEDAVRVFTEFLRTGTLSSTIECGACSGQDGVPISTGRGADQTSPSLRAQYPGRRLLCAKATTTARGVVT